MKHVAEVFLLLLYTSTEFVSKFTSTSGKETLPLFVFDFVKNVIPFGELIKLGFDLFEIVLC